METKLTGGIYTRHSSGYDVLASNATSSSSGGIALFWRGNISYEVEETRIWGPNVISLHLMMGSIRFFVVGCYIPPNDLEALACVDKAWRECPAGTHPILVGDLNVNLRTPRTEREETIAEQVDAMDLVDMSRHFRQRSGNRLWGRCVLTWSPGGEGRLPNVRTIESPSTCPPPPRHLITKLKGSTESHFCTPRFPPSRRVPLAEKISKGFNAVATRGRRSRPL